MRHAPLKTDNKMVNSCQHQDDAGGVFLLGAPFLLPRRFFPDLLGRLLFGFLGAGASADGGVVGSSIETDGDVAYVKSVNVPLALS